MTPTRRAFLVGVLGAALAGGAAGCSGASGPPLTVAAGEPGGFYVEFAQLLAGRLTAAGLPATVLTTGGSVDNLRLIADGRAGAGLSLADAVTPAPALRALGRVYANYMQLVVRAEDPLRTVADLRDRPVSLGAEGSGAALFGDRLLAAAQVTARVARRPLREAVAALESGAVDALLWSGGVPTPALAALAGRRPIRLLPLDAHLPALRAAFGDVYGRAAVPAEGYGAGGEVATVGVANLLVAAAALPDATAGRVARTLVLDAPALVPPAALGTQYLDPRSLIGTAPLPLHPGAAAAYRALHA